MTWKFKQGSIIQFKHMEHEENKYDLLGASIPYLGFDELNSFSDSQFFFLFGSNRSTCGVKPCIRATTNPDPRSWVARFIEWWINQDTGYAIPERGGVIRWFCRDGDRIVWADTAEELQKEYGIMPKSFTFIPARVYDNKILMEKDPTYVSSLQAQSKVDKERFLNGNWKISEGAGVLFQRDWFQIIPDRPHGLTQFVRFWDLAATAPDGKNDPDWTCGCLISFKDGQWIVCDLQRFRGTPKIVEERIKQTAMSDPIGTRIRLEQEPGASGVSMVDHYARYVLPGFDFVGVKAIRNKGTRAAPLSAAAQNRNVVLVRNPLWNSEFLDEMENFKGDDSGHDDIVDATAGALSELKASTGEWKFAIPMGIGNYRPLMPNTNSGGYQNLGG